jgi:hypothetical protein
MVWVYTRKGRQGTLAEQFRIFYLEWILDNRYAWQTHGNRFSPLPMTFRWHREV